MIERVRGAPAGVVAAAVWAASEPLLGRVFGTPYSDVELLGGLVTRGRARPAGLAIHLANGATFGWAFERLGGQGPLVGLAAAEAENAILWPVLAVMDRVHPNRRSGSWPPLARSPRVAGYELAAHALFGIVLGALVRGR
jgi:hypothetical protein